ncbi:MAG: hypothetical protein DRO46_00995 [Candidatus Hecatellales archaeon]|nr:MAG: hypothetical protein DRO46_00995 [Candidatus Hecatellales archaeon]
MVGAFSEAFKFKREIRDPIYGYIYITGVENEIIDRPEFQRLDRLYQTYATHHVYPGSTHTRKAHALGVMYLAHKALIRILRRQSPAFDKMHHPLYGEPCISRENLKGLDRLNLGEDEILETLQALRLAALLHDVGHGPFCHTFEDACNQLASKLGKPELRFDHEQMGVRIVSERLSQVLDRFMDSGKILSVMRGEAPRFLHEIIDGPYDVDKLDYLNRDSYHAGTREYGSVDYERIIDGFRVREGRLLISKTAAGALLDSFVSLQHMYANVYYHRTSRIFEHMIYDALFLMPEFLESLVSSPDQLLNYDDFSFIAEVKHRRETKHTVDRYEEAYQIFRDVLERRKRYATVYERRLSLRTVSRRRGELEKLKELFEEKYGELGLRVDHRGEIKPVGVDFSRLYRLLEEPFLMDEDKGSPITLKEHSAADYQTLSRYQILFYIFADRRKFKEARYEEAFRRVRREAEEWLSSIEREEFPGG